MNVLMLCGATAMDGERASISNRGARPAPSRVPLADCATFTSRHDARYMLHHISFGVTNLERSATFYDATLSALGYVRVWADDTAVGYGHPGGGDKLAIKLQSLQAAPPGPGFHLAFSAPSREAVALFHAEALKNGGTDNGAPGLRPDYGDNYFAAFVVDPDGYRVEAVINAVT